MDRRNVNPETKFVDTDGFKLTDIDTGKSLMLIPCDTAGNFSWTGVTRAPLVRNAMQTSTTSNQYSDLERPWISIPQEDWSGGRANEIFTKDTTRYRDGKRAQAAFNQVIFNAPLEHYSEGFRKAVTNCPGSLFWQKLKGNSRYVAIAFQTATAFTAGELYIHLRRRGKPGSALKVQLLNGLNGTVLASHDYTLSEITDTVSEFRKFTFTGVSLSANTTYYIKVSSTSADSENYWEVGCKMMANSSTKTSANNTDYLVANFDLYFRIAQAQTQSRCKFFMYEQLMFMIRQLPNGTPSLWMNGDIGKATGATSTTITDSSKSWATNAYKGARVGLVYKGGSHGQVSVWRTIVSNTATALTIDKAWDVTPSSGCVFIIVDTPLWTEISGHGLTAAITDIHVIRGVVYFAQGDYTDARKMRWNNGAFEWKTLTGIKASFFQSVRDSTVLMFYRGRNDGIDGKRTIERSRLLDWESAATSWTTVTTALTTVEPKSGSTSGTITNTEVEQTGSTSRTTTGSTTTVAGNKSTTDVTDISVAVSVVESGGKKTTTTTTTTNNSSSTTETVLRTCGVTESKDFLGPDQDQKQYVITISTLTSDNYTGKCVVTLQESEDNSAWHDVQSVIATSTGVWRIFAHCQYRYRRFMLTAVGTNATVNNIAITTSDIPHFEDPFFLLDNFGKITRLFEYGAEQYKSLWVFQEGMVGSINKVDNTTDTYTYDRINLDELQTTAEEWNAKAVNTADVYLTFAWLNGLQRYYNTQIEGKGPDHDEGLPFDRQGRVTQIVTYPSNIIICIDGEDGFSSVMLFNQAGWHELYRTPNAGERIHDMAFQPIYGKRPDRLWLQVGDDVVWLSMPSKILYAIQDSEAEYTHESVLVSAWLTAGMTDVEKLWESLKVMADYMKEGVCWVEADYQLDEETEWHPIKNLYIESPSQKENFSTKYSVNGKKLRYRLRLQTSDMNKTPKVNVVVIEAVGRVDIKQSYTFYFRNIKYKKDLNGGFEDAEPLDVQNQLDEWANKLRKLRLNSRWKIYDDKIVYLDAVQTSVLNELSEGYIAQITLNEL